MLKPYRITEETDDNITYQYNSLYSWVLISIIILLFLGIYLENTLLEVISIVLVALYFFAKLVFGREVTSRIRQALKAGSVQLSGGKYSFSNPLKIKVAKRI